MEIEEIKNIIVDLSKNLIEQGKILCTNIFPEQTMYMVRVQKSAENSHDFGYLKYVQYLHYKSANKINLDELSRSVYKYIKKNKYSTVVELTLYKANNKETLIMVELIKLKNYSEKLDFKALIPIPINYKKDEKFDCNWYYNKSKEIYNNLNKL